MFGHPGEFSLCQLASISYENVIAAMLLPDVSVVAGDHLVAAKFLAATPAA